MRDENNFHSQRELTQSLLPFFSDCGESFQKNCFCAQSCFNVLLRRVNFGSQRLYNSGGILLFVGELLWAAGGSGRHESQCGWTKITIRICAGRPHHKLSMYEGFKPLSPGNRLVFLLHPDEQGENGGGTLSCESDGDHLVLCFFQPRCDECWPYSLRADSEGARRILGLM